MTCSQFLIEHISLFDLTGLAAACVAQNDTTGRKKKSNAELHSTVCTELIKLVQHSD